MFKPLNQLSNHIAVSNIVYEKVYKYSIILSPGKLNFYNAEEIKSKIELNYTSFNPSLSKALCLPILFQYNCLDYNTSLISLATQFTSNTLNGLNITLPYQRFYNSIYFNGNFNYTSATSNYRIVYYEDRINNFNFRVTEISIMSIYDEMVQGFNSNMTSAKKVANSILIGLSVLVVLISTIYLYREVLEMTDRMQYLSQIKNDLFFKQGIITESKVPIKEERVAQLIKMINQDKVKEADKIEIAESDRFYEEYIILVNEIKVSLVNFLENFEDVANSEKEEIYLFRRKYRLSKS